MNKTKLKIVVITNEARLPEVSSAITQVLSEKFEMHIDVVSEPEPNYKEVLKNFDERGFDVAIIDDTAILNPNAAENQILKYATEPRNRNCRLRVLFLARADRPSDSPVFARLVRKGIYDLVIPIDLPSNINPFLRMATLIVYPNKYSDVAVYDRPNVTPALIDERCAPKPIYDKDGIKASAKKPTAGNRTIGVIGVSRHTGTSHVAQALARSAALAGYNTSLVVSRQEDFDNIRDFFPHFASEDGAVKVNGIEIWHGKQLSDTNELQTYTVFDFQVAETDTNVPKELRDERYNRAIELTKLWSRCDCKVLVASSAAQKIRYLEHRLREASVRDLDKWNIVLDLPSDAMYDRIASAVAKKSEHANVVDVHEITDPLALLEIPPFAKRVFAKSFDFDLVENIAVSKKTKTPPTRETETPKRSLFALFK
jgi:hypothetical protein